MRSSASIFSQCSRSSRCSAELRKAFLPTFLSRSYCSGRWIGFIRFLRIWYTRSLCGSAASATCTVSFDDLTETEKSAALVGASPDDFNPIAFMNDAHYNTLRTKNALASDLAQKIEAYRVVASASQ